MTFANKTSHFLNFNRHYMTKALRIGHLTLCMLEEIKRNIKIIRETHNLSREELAIKMDADVGIVKRLEWGKSSIDLQRLVKVAECFQMDVIDLLTYPEKFVNVNTLPQHNERIEAMLQIKLSKGQDEKTLKLESIEIK